MSDDVAAFGFYALPPMAERLRRPTGALGAGTLVALSDRAGTLRIASDHRNRGELGRDRGGVLAAARLLFHLVCEVGFPRLDALKIDVEGLESPVLRHYFAHAERPLWPRLGCWRSGGER